MEKIKNFVLPEHTNSLYEKEAISSIGLTREIANKINEVIEAYNNLSENDLRWKQTQEGIIRKGVIFMKDNLINSLQAIFDTLDKEKFVGDRVKSYTETLESRLDVLLGSVTTGTSTMDAEIIDARTGDDNVTYRNLGESIRNQIHYINPKILLYYGIEYDSATGNITLKTDADGKILFTIAERKYSGILSASIADVETVYDSTSGRPNVVSLNITDGVATLKCTTLNTYYPEDNDVILFVIYQKKIFPVSLSPESIFVDSSNKKEYISKAVGLNGQLIIDGANLNITLTKGFYAFPVDLVGAITIEEQSVPYEIADVVRYLILDSDKVLRIVERQYIFQKEEYCLGCIYNGKFIPVEISPDNVVYKNGDKEVITTDHPYITLNDVFRTLSDTAHTTKIVLLGDSITHGTGGTGFAQDGETIISAGGTTFKRNTTGYCWANLFKEYIESRFNAEVINNGCSGTHSQWLNTHKATLIPADTDIVVLTIGTNDRNDSDTTGHTKEDILSNYYNNLNSIIRYCHDNGIHIALCSPIPASSANEAEGIRLANICDIANVVQRVASENNIEFANLYNEIFYHLKDNNITISSLLTDGLHPNDEMYQLMFYKYLKLFNIAPDYTSID